MIVQHGMQVQTPTTSQDLNWGGGGAVNKADGRLSIFLEQYASDGDLASVFHGHIKRRPLAKISPPPRSNEGNFLKQMKNGIRESQN
jgi:hypothetical protein